MSNPKPDIADMTQDMHAIVDPSIIANVEGMDAEEIRQLAAILRDWARQLETAAAHMESERRIGSVRILDPTSN